ncbi:MAG: 2'-5' RNA ligase family protein [Sediminibacterium sp.]|nr:2'-5' RNA ligase family protein [Sediminibacterium sp.]
MYSKYFIAIVLPEPFLTEAESIKLELLHKYGLKGALRSPAHITLHRPFQFKSEKESILIKTLERFHFQELEIVLKGFDCFAPRVVFINVESSLQLNVVHHQLTRFAKRELQLFNEAEDLRGFHPHVTLAFRDLKKNDFAQVYNYVIAKQFSASFPVNQLALLKLSKTWEVIHLF